MPICAPLRLINPLKFWAILIKNFHVESILLGLHLPTQIIHGYSNNARYVTGKEYLLKMELHVLEMCLCKLKFTEWNKVSKNQGFSCYEGTLWKPSVLSQAEVEIASREKCKKKTQGKYSGSFCSKAYCLRPSRGQTIWRGSLATFAIASDGDIPTLKRDPFRGFHPFN